MKLKIFAPDFTEIPDRKNCVPLYYAFPLLQQDYSNAVDKYGDWLNPVELVNSIEECDIVVPVYYINYYYKNNRVDALLEMNKSAVKAGKLTVCWTSGDAGITPPLQNFHLFRCGGYLHKNKGNQFCYPPFFEDPVFKYFSGVLPVVENKTPKPLIGFCGQGRAGAGKLMIDIGRGIYQHVEKFLQKRYDDLEQIESSVYNRSQMLDKLENSGVVETNFTRHRLYRAGAKDKSEKEKDNIVFYENMRASQYIFCYRGNGNFSVRLYETLASGRIPFIIRSDNNLPWQDKINWSIFPQIPVDEWKNLDNILASFHNNLSNDDFKHLQMEGRRIWEEYLCYKGFMKNFISKYMQLT